MKGSGFNQQQLKVECPGINVDEEGSSRCPRLINIYPTRPDAVAGVRQPSYYILTNLGQRDEPPTKHFGY
jgi:hypothetical protein